MNESLKYPLIFFHIPKNAGVSVRRILGLDTKYHPKVFKKTTNLAIDIQKYTDPRIFNSYTKFTVVRNPWDRMVSLYHFRKQQKDLYMNNLGVNKSFGPDGKVWGFKRWIMDPGIKNVDSNEIYFEMASGAFLKETKFNVNFLRANIEFINQLDVVCDLKGNLLVNKILRFENLNEDWNNMFSELNLKPIPQLPSANKSSHKHYSDYYDDESQEFIAKMFKKDINFFEYEFERK